MSATSSRSQYMEEPVREVHLGPPRGTPPPRSPLDDPAIQRMLERFADMGEERAGLQRQLVELTQRRMDLRTEARQRADRRTYLEQQKLKTPNVQGRESIQRQIRWLDADDKQNADELTRVEKRYAAPNTEWQEIARLYGSCKKYLIDEVGLREQDLPPQPPIGRKPHEATTVVATVRG